MSYSYRYQLVGTSIPALVCPRCEKDWTGSSGVVVFVCTNGRDSHEAEHDSFLDNEGNLYDTWGLIAKGQHSYTKCGGCDGRMIDMDEVEEVQVHEDGRKEVCLDRPCGHGPAQFPIMCDFRAPVSGCPRCGAAHVLPCFELQTVKPAGTGESERPAWTHWATCPKTWQPILMRFDVSGDRPADDEDVLIDGNEEINPLHIS